MCVCVCVCVYVCVYVCVCVCVNMYNVLITPTCAVFIIHSQLGKINIQRHKCEKRFVF